MRGRRGRESKKVQLKVYISYTTNEKLRELIAQKYQSYEKGLLSHEVEQAILTWIAMHTQAQSTPIHKPNPPNKVAVVFAQVKDWLLGHYYDVLIPGQQILSDHLEEAIMAIRGSDQRTVRKWMEAFERFGLIKHIKGKVYEIV